LRVRNTKEGPRRPRRRVRKRRLAALLAVLLVLSLLSFTFGLVRAVASEIPSLDPAAQRADVDTVVYASNGRSVLAVLRGDEARVLIDTEDIAPIMRQAIVAVEDKRFFEHDGIDLRGVARALWADLRSQAIVEGGSTITQQFVKNAYIRNERSLARKVREAALAWQLEETWSKDRILTAYLNTIYFGNGAYGIQQASKTYFQKGAKYLELHEAALLAGLPADPALYDPVTHPRTAKLRRRHVLDVMLEQGKITRADHRRAHRAALPPPDRVRLPGTRGKAQYFVNYVKDQLVERYGAGRVFGGGLRVTSTIDLNLQEQARVAIEKVLKDPEGPAAALVAIDPKTGAVKAMFGGRNFRESQFNLAAQAERQPGSAFKPIVLATAIREGISPLTEIESRPVSIDAGDRIWPVTNYEKTYLGRITLERALVSSDNSVYAQLTDLVGPEAIVETAHELGIGSHLDEYFAIGLGLGGEVNALEMARAYATIANKGIRVDGSLMGDRPRVIEEVERVRAGGRVDENTPEGERVLETGEALVMTEILEDVVRAGTGRRASIPGLRVAGKTGTTDNYADAWFVGYTPELVVAVWVGYPDRLRPMLTEFGGEPVAGGTLPAEIWRAFVERLDKPAEGSSFDSAPYLGATATYVVKRGGEWRLDNGLCRGAERLVFFSDEVPERTADCKANEVSVPLVVGMTEEAALERLAGQPLEAELVYQPAKPGRPPAIVLNQEPKAGGLSANDSVRLWVSKAEHGLVPNFVGSTLADASREVKRLKLRVRVVGAPGPSGMVLEQAPRAGVTSAPKLRMRLVVGDGSQRVSS
jgi:penicillin-binding protein 1A